jgi:hypothetical protein
MIAKRSIRFVFALFIVLPFLTSGCGSSGPTAQGAFINTSDAPMKISFIPTDKTDKTSILQTVQPRSVAFFPLPTKVYNVVGLDTENEATWTMIGYEVKKTASPQYLCFDLAGEFDYTMANAKFLYEPGNSFAAELAKSSGPGTLINGRIDASKPFLLDFAPVWPYQALPAKVNAMSAVWALAPRPKADIEQSELVAVIQAYLQGLEVER